MAPPTRYPNAQVRREEVRRLLDIHGHLKMDMRRALAARFGCTPAVIGHDIGQIVAERAPATPAVLPVLAPPSVGDEREVALLRALGRLELLSSAQIKGLIFPDTSVPTMRALLRRLHDGHLIWRTTTSMSTLAPPEAGGKRRPPPPKAPYIYGLTHEGKGYLERTAAETPAALARLRSRDRRGPDMPRQQLTHDLLVSSWCCSVIDAARRCPLLLDMECHVEFVAATDERGRPMQRFDAYLALRFARQQRPQTLPGWWLPWHEGTPDDRQLPTVRFALEVDRGTEQLKILLGKAHMYASLTASGHYGRTLGGPVTPVVLAPPGRRAAQIAREWQAAWPGGLGVISTPLKANHPQQGALWGSYFTLADNPARPVALLGQLFPSLAAWEQLTRGWVAGRPD